MIKARTGRPPNPNRPPYTKAVRISEECRRLLTELRIGRQPMGDVIMRALLQLQHTKSELSNARKKVEDLEAELWNQIASRPSVSAKVNAKPVSLYGDGAI